MYGRLFSDEAINSKLEMKCSKANIETRPSMFYKITPSKGCLGVAEFVW